MRDRLPRRAFAVVRMKIDAAIKRKSEREER